MGFTEFFEHAGGLAFRNLSAFCDTRGVVGKDRHCEQAGVFRAGWLIAKVATGMPPGIWTMDSNESMPLSSLLSTGTPSTGKSGVSSRHTGQVSCATGTAMMTSMPRPFGGACEFGHQFRRAVRRDNATLMGRRSREDLVGGAHRLPVRLAAHDYGNKWRRRSGWRLTGLERG